MAKKDNEMVTGIEPVSLHKKFVQPVSINKEFTSFVAFKHVRLKKIVIKGGKETPVDDLLRAPLMIVWDGKTIDWFLCQEGQTFDYNKKSYIIDRSIDDNPMLPDEQFIGKLMNPPGKGMIERFKAKDLFDEIHSYLERYFYLEKPYLYKIITLFIVNCWVFDAHESTPYLFIRSPVRGCGKSHLGESITQMCNGQMNINFKAHHLFRIVHGTKTIPAFDEIKKWGDKDYKMSEDTKDIISLVNVGFQKGGSKVPRLIEKKGGARGEMQTVLYESFSPKIMITTTGYLPQDMASRCIELIIQKAPPKGIDYGDRWYEPARKKKLKKIRELGLLFRLKYGKEISDISENTKWRQELDTAKVFRGLRNRELEIFRPLVILTLKYKPKWKEQVNIYVRKYIEMRDKLEPGPVNSLLWAMRSFYNEVVHSNFKTMNYEEWGDISLEEDEIHGTILHISPKAIADRAKEQTALDVFGKNAPSQVGKLLNELGFVSGKDRTKKGYVRTVKVKQLADMCERYLGMSLNDDNVDNSLDLVQRLGLIREILMDNKGGLILDDLQMELNNRMTEAEMNAGLKHFIEKGKVAQLGMLFQWQVD